MKVINSPFSSNERFSRRPDSYEFASLASEFQNDFGNQPKLNYASSASSILQNSFVSASAFMLPAGTTLPNTVSVKPGDTFDSIVQRDLRNEEGLATKLATYNGYSPGDKPRPNSTLNVPPLIPSRLTATTTIAYDKFVQAMIGNIIPTFGFKMPPPEHRHPNEWSELIGVLSAGLIIAFIPQLTPYVLEFLSSAATALGAAGVGTALGFLIFGLIVSTINFLFLNEVDSFIRALIPSIIWVPYMALSKRVKATFVN